MQPRIKQHGDVTRWTFTNVGIEGDAQLSKGTLRHAFPAKKGGIVSVAFGGAPDTRVADVWELF
jgi:hypothetical protein